MSRKIVAVVLAVLLCAAVGVFAKETKPSKQFPWMVSYNQPGQLNFYASAGWYGWGFDVSAGPEFVIGAFDLAGIPLEWGINVRGLVGFGGVPGYTSWIDWGVAALVSLHWGVDFGGPLKFDWYAGIGPSVSGSTGSYYPVPFTPWFASFNGIAWHFSDNFALIGEYAYTYYASIAGIGIKMNL